MNWIQKLVAKIVLPAPKNRYEGAYQSVRRSWLDTSYTSARFDISGSTRQQIVRKSRFFEQNSGLMNRLGDLFECYTVGSSFVVQPASTDAVWNAKAKKWWDIWSRYPDIGSRQSFGTFMSLAARGWFFDGESFILLTRGESGKPRLQLIEPQNCVTPAERVNDADTFDGVRFDRRTGRTLSYYIGNELKQGEIQDIRSIPSDSVVHIFEPNRAGQLRGLPFVTPVINDLHDLDDLQKLEMESCKLASSVAQIVKTASGEVSAANLRSGATQSSDTAQNYYENVFGSSVKVLQHGDDFQQFASDRPSVNMREYWRQLTEKVCAGVGIPYVLVLPESMQGTVYRGALDMSSVWFRSRHQVMASAARRIWEYVMSYAIATDPTLGNPPDDWYEVSIQAPRAPNVDVGRNSAAQLAELEAGTTTFDEVYGARGIDWRSALTAKAEQAKFIAELAEQFEISIGQISSTQGAEAKPQQAPVETPEVEPETETKTTEDEPQQEPQKVEEPAPVAAVKPKAKRKRKQTAKQ